MALPEKDHFLLTETAVRWNAQLHDLYYYAERGLLEVQTWLEDSVYSLKKPEDGDVVPVLVGLDDYKGYAVVEPEELRKIFRSDSRSLISAHDLVVSRTERDRFESTYEINCCCERAARAAKCDPGKPPMSFVGRPSVMHRILTHFKERCDQEEIKSSLQKESDYLAAWAAEHITDSQPPQSKAIMNAIRADYRINSQRILGNFRQP
jgi:hypothetical protein